MNGFKFDHGSISSCSNQNLANEYKPNDDSIDHHPPFLQTNPHPPGDPFPSSGTSSDGDSSDGNDSSNAVLKYISEILMEEDLEGKPCMLQDCLALQAAEKSFYDVLGQKYPTSSNDIPSCSRQNIENPDDHFTRSSSSRDYCNTSINWVDSPKSNLLVPNLCSDIQSLLKSEASNSVLNTERIIFSPKICPPQDGEEVVVSSVVDGRHYSSYGSWGRKIHQREDSDYLEEGRRNKHSAISLAQSDEQPEIFDEVLLCNGETDESESCSVHQESQTGSNKKVQQNGRSKASNGVKTERRKRDNKREVVDLWTLLTQCAQAVAINDQRTANKLLKQIRLHSSAFGDGTERLAHYFGNGLEARLLGSQTPIHSHISHRASAADILKAYQVYVLSEKPQILTRATNYNSGSDTVAAKNSTSIKAQI